MKDIDKIGYKYLRILKTVKVKEKEMKEKFTKEYPLRITIKTDTTKQTE